MTDDNVFKQAARYGDAETEEHGLEGACELQGLDLPTLVHAAEQRALRVALMAAGRPLPAPGLGMATVELSAHDRWLIQTVLMPAYMDGIYIGWRARGLHDDTEAAELLEAQKRLDNEQDDDALYDERHHDDEGGEA